MAVSRDRQGGGFNWGRLACEGKKGVLQAVDVQSQLREPVGKTQSSRSKGEVVVLVVLVVIVIKNNIINITRMGAKAELSTASLGLCSATGMKLPKVSPG